MSILTKRFSFFNHTALFMLVFIPILISCRENKKSSSENGDVDFHLRQVSVENYLSVGKQLYVQGQEKGHTIWLVIPSQELMEGDQLFFTGSGIIRKLNYRSEELNRSFDSILFVDKVTRQKKTLQHEEHHEEMTMPPGHSGGKVAPVKQDLLFKSLKGTVIIARLYENKKQFVNKKVKVSGVVVKVNRNIMGRNWVHLQDGTDFQNNFDLTVTTMEEVNKGDTATFEGIIALDKDFTAGYFYEVIMEQAILVNKQR